MKYLAALSLLACSTTWAVIPANPHAAHQATAIRGDEHTHHMLITQQRQRIHAYQQRLHKDLQRLVEAKAKLWQLEHGQNQPVLPLSPGPVIPQHDHPTPPPSPDIS